MGTPGAYFVSLAQDRMCRDLCYLTLQLHRSTVYVNSLQIIDGMSLCRRCTDYISRSAAESCKERCGWGWWDG